MSGGFHLKPTCNRPRNPLRTRPNNTNPKVRRRANYAHIQRSFKTSRKCCARDDLSGSWRVEPTPVPKAEQEPYWRDISTPSVEDTRQPQPKGPIAWGLLAPITEGDVACAIKDISDSSSSSCIYLYMIENYSRADVVVL